MDENTLDAFKGYLLTLREMRPDIPRTERIEILALNENEHVIVLRWGNHGKCARILAVVKGSLGAAGYIGTALNAVELFMPKTIRRKKEEIVKPEGPLTEEMTQEGEERGVSDGE